MTVGFPALAQRIGVQVGSGVLNVLQLEGATARGSGSG